MMENLKEFVIGDGASEKFEIKKKDKPMSFQATFDKQAIEALQDMLTAVSDQPIAVTEECTASKRDFQPPTVRLSNKIGLIGPIVFQLVAYFMGNLRMTGEAFFLTLFIVFLVVMSSAGLGLAIGACVTNLRKATTMASVILVAFFMAGGFFVQHVPPFIKWLEYISFHYWGYKLLLKVQYKSSQQIKCGEPTGCIPIEDSQALYGHKLVGGSKEVVILLAMIIFYRVVANIGLRQMKVNLA
ncbi:unnamed protein product [Calypogeia fissa]